jgi:hypothetical protein
MFCLGKLNHRYPPYETRPATRPSQRIQKAKTEEFPAKRSVPVLGD